MSSKMRIEENKIMFVVHSLRGGGAEKVASILLNSLAKSEDVPIVLVLFDKESSAASPHGIDVRYLDVKANGNVFYKGVKFFKAIYRLAAIIKEERPRSILSFMDYANIISIISNWLSSKKNKVIISVHSFPTAQMREYAANFWEKIMGLLIRKFYNKADSIIAVSKHVCNDLVENFKIDKSRIHIIHNPIDLKKIDSLSNEDVSEKLFTKDVPIILSVGRLSKEKGFEYLLKAFSLLRGKNNARLVILGEGKEEANLKELSINLGIDKKVFFLGFKDNPYKYMKRSTIFVLPSLYESFGLVMIEAMACGIPVIATKSYKGFEDIIEHERTGLLVNVGDEQAIAESMLRLLNDEKLRRSLSEEAKERVAKFSIEKITNQYKAVLDI